MIEKAQKRKGTREGGQDRAGERINKAMVSNGTSLKLEALFAPWVRHLL